MNVVGGRERASKNRAEADAATREILAYHCSHHRIRLARNKKVIHKKLFYMLDCLMLPIIVIQQQQYAQNTPNQRVAFVTIKSLAVRASTAKLDGKKKT